MNRAKFEHNYKFDPSYGYSLADLKKVDAPPMPSDFQEFWQKRYENVLEKQPKPVLKDLGINRDGYVVYEVSYTSTKRAKIKGWLLIPAKKKVKRGFVVLHGYGGRTEPDFHLPFKDAALFFPVCRGLPISFSQGISPDAIWHVLHDLDKKQEYIHGKCVEDVWMGVSALLRLRPEVAGRIGYLGISFGGGIGALALAFDNRIQLAHLNIPSFGNHPLRLTMKTTGSGASVQRMYRKKKDILETLLYYDAAVAAQLIKIPVHCACALFDPMVAPPGQFAIYNALAGPKELFVLQAGHFEYQDQQKEEVALLIEIEQFFHSL